MAERTMSAKFGGWCKSCKSEIDVGAEIIWSRENGARHSTLGACEVAKAKRDRGLKYPKLRVLDSDGSSELVLGLTGNRSKVPGSVTVKRDGEYLGLVRPTGEAFGAWDAPELFDAKLIVHLVQLAENPAIAAKEYAGLVGACSFCGSTITDEGSVEVGYGPVCAKNWGLPHTPKGTKVFDPSATEMAA